MSNLDPAHIDALRGQGYSYSAIGAQLGETKDTVRGLHKRYLARRVRDANAIDAQPISRPSSSDGAGRLFISTDVPPEGNGQDLAGDSGRAGPLTKAERGREAGRRWRAQNPERAKQLRREGMARFRARHPEHMAHWRAENAERVQEYQAHWRAENAEHRREYAALWRNKNPGKVALQSIRQGAKRRGA